MGRTIDVTRPDGRSVSAYLAEPADPTSAPGLVVIQEWWGLNDQIRGVADRLAAEGYRALVPDLYRGKTTLEAKEAEHFAGGLDFGDAASQDIRGAVQWLKRDGAKVGVTGFCMGGALTLLAAAHVPESDANVCWYGYPPLDYVDATRIHAPLLAHFAMDDAYFPISGVDALEAKLRSANVAFEFHRYDARHAFANETADGTRNPTQYDAAAAALAWQRTNAFLKAHLR